MSDETMERAFTVDTPVRVRIGNIRGSVDVRPGEDGAVHVTAVKHLDNGNAERTEVIIEQEKDGRVHARTRFRGRRIFGWGRPCRVDYTVRVPRACDLKVEVVSSAAGIQGLQGQIDLASVSGDLTLGDLSGQIEVRTVSGDVHAENLSGPLHLKSVSGDLQVKTSHLAAAEAETVSGDIALETPLGQGPYRFKSVSGDVRLVVPPDAACTVSGKSVSGQVRLALPSTTSEQGRGRWRFQVQGGGAEVHFESVSGDLHIGAV